MTILLLMFLFQFLPKVYHCLCLMRRMQKVTGYLFGTIWWGFALNLIAYFIASHVSFLCLIISLPAYQLNSLSKFDQNWSIVSQVAGGCWYVLAIQRVASCLTQQCASRASCNLSLSCSQEVCYQFFQSTDTSGYPCSGNSTMMVNIPLCLDANGPFRHGIYQWALPVISSNSITVKILYPIFWGLMTLRYTTELTSFSLEIADHTINFLCYLQYFWK